MGGPTLIEVSKADEFGPSLCAPVAELIKGFGEELPAEDILIFADGFAGSTYLAPNSKELKYYYNTLVEFKDILKDSVKADVLDRRFDPAISFFKSHLEKKKAVRLNCRDERLELTAKPFLHPLLKSEVNLGRVRDYLNEEFGLDIYRDIENWLDHRIIYADLKKDSKNLVIVVADVFVLATVAYDYFYLLSNLIEHEGNYNVVLAFGMDQVKFKEMSSSYKKEKAYNDIVASKNTICATILFKSLLNSENKKLIFEFAEKENPNFIEALEGENTFLNSIKFILNLALFEADLGHYWALGDEDTENKYIKILSTMKNEKTLSSEERYKLNQELYKVGAENGKVIAKNLVRKLAEGSKSGKPQIVIVPVGYLMMSDFVGALTPDINASVIGLLSTKFKDIFGYVKK